MSVVVALKEGDTFYIGADMQASYGNLKYLPQSKSATMETFKIWEVANTKRAVMGGVGDLREIQIIKYADNLIDELSVLKSAINTKYVVNNLAAQMHKLLSENHAIKSDALTMHSEYIFCFKNKAWIISSSFAALEIDDYAAIGSGQEVALGSLKSTENSDLSPEERVEQAIQAAIQNTVYVGGEVEILLT